MGKKIGIILILITLIISLPSCSIFGGGNEVDASNANVEMVAEILEINDTILVDVKKSEYAFGPYVIILHENITYLSSNGSKISKSRLKVGDLIKINYSGQVMLSYPPQVVAYTITLIE